jgi:hypothetical protein
MTVKEFREYLAQFPDDMPIVEQIYSDYRPMTIESWEKIIALKMSGGSWYMTNDWRLDPKSRYHRIDEQGTPIEVLFFKGN